MKKLFLLAILFALAPVFYVFDGSILKDLSLRSESLSPAFIATTDRRCKTRTFVIQSCSYKYKLDNQDKKQSYFFLSFGAPETLLLLRGNTSGGITSDVGQNYLLHRIATILFFPLLAIFAIFKGGRSNVRAASPRVAPPASTPVAAPRPPASSTPIQRSGKHVFGKRR